MKRLFACFLLAFAGLARGAAGDTQPLRPVFQGTVTISCASTTSATSVASLISSLIGDIQLEIQNAGTVAVFVETGSISTTAAVVASGYPILAGQSKVITVGPRITHVGCISASGTQTVYVTVGTGN